MNRKSTWPPVLIGFRQKSLLGIIYDICQKKGLVLSTKNTQMNLFYVLIYGLVKSLSFWEGRRSKKI